MTSAVAILLSPGVACDDIPKKRHLRGKLRLSAYRIAKGTIFIDKAFVYLEIANRRPFLVSRILRACLTPTASDAYARKGMTIVHRQIKGGVVVVRAEISRSRRLQSCKEKWLLFMTVNNVYICHLAVPSSKSFSLPASAPVVQSSAHGVHREK
jgi:hypothetical protein